MPDQRDVREPRVSPEWGRGLDEALRAPLDAELAWGRHVAEERGRRDDCGAREIAGTAHAHAVCPVAIERGDRALALLERIGSLTETGAAPGLANLGSGRAEDVGDRLAPESRIVLLDVALDAAGAGEDDELLDRARRSLLARGAQDERRLEQVAVPAVRARADERFVEGQPLTRDLRRRERVGRTERFRDQWDDLGKVQRLVDLVARVGARRESRVGEIGRAFLAIPGVREVVGSEDAVERLALGH